MKTGFIIVSYNSKARELMQTLKSISEFRSVIIDNGGTRDINLKNTTQLLKSDSNKGFSAGANMGIRKLFGDRIDWFVILNQDIHISAKAVDLFIKNLEKQPPSICGPIVGNIDPKRWTAKVLAKGPIDYISGSCIAIHRDVIEKIGEFYKSYFVYYEEVDLCIRARRVGFPIKKIDIPGFVHKDEPILEKGSFYHEYYLARNHLLFVERNAPTRVKLRELARMPLTLLEHYRNGNIGALTGIKDFALRKFGKYRK